MQQLSTRQQTFVREYLIDGNATRAARAAGFSERSAEVLGHRLVRNVNVAAEIQRRQRRKLERLDVKAEHVLENLRRIAFCDVREFFGVDGVPLSIDELPPELATCVDLDSDGKTVKIRLRRADALGKLAQHLDLLRQDVSPAPTVAIGAVTNINVTEVILEQLSTEELRVLEKMLLLKAAASPIPPSPQSTGAPDERSRS
jgi:hypothetical protein